MAEHRPTEDQLRAVRIAARAIVSAVGAAGDLGAHGGTLYAGLMAYGCNIQQFQSMMSALERKGYVRREGDLYFLAARGEAVYANEAQAAVAA